MGSQEWAPSVFFRFNRKNSGQFRLKSSGFFWFRVFPVQPGIFGTVPVEILRFSQFNREFWNTRFSRFNREFYGRFRFRFNIWGYGFEVSHFYRNSRTLITLNFSMLQHAVVIFLTLIYPSKVNYAGRFPCFVVFRFCRFCSVSLKWTWMIIYCSHENVATQRFSC